MRRTKEEAQKTRENILNAAARLFYEKGFYNTSLEDVAKSIKATRGAVYWHFKNKLEIFDALHDSLHQPFIQRVTDDLEKDHTQPMLQLKDLTLKILLDLIDDEEKRMMLSLFLIRCDYSGDLAIFKERHCQKKREKMALFQKYFEKAKEKNLIPNTACPEVLTISYNCFLKGIVFEYIENPECMDMAKHGPALVNQYFKGFNV